VKTSKCSACGNPCDPRALRCRQCSNVINPPALGHEVSLKTRRKISGTLHGHTPWNKDKGEVKLKCPVSKERMSVQRSTRMKKNNPCKRPEIKEKIRQTVLELYRQHPEILGNRKPSGINQHSTHLTSVEKPIAQILQESNITFSHNHRIGKYFVDFLILENCVIECDGKYWHRIRSDASQKEAVKDTYLRSQGYRVFRFTEDEIVGNASNCVLKCLEVR
jgi:very-short-patch-repair endonuclease